MTRFWVAASLLVMVCLTVGGCGTLAGKLPRVKLEPPASAQKAAATDPNSTAGVTPDAEPQEPQVVYGEMPKPAGGSGDGGGGVKYVPAAAQRTLTTSDLRGLSKWQLDVLRNEIYAAHGRRFDRADLQQYFERKTWYTPDAGFSEARLSSLEKRNAAFIAAYQKRMGQTSGGTRTASKPRRSSSGGGGFVLPFSSDRNVTSSDLAGLSKWELDVARNEIHARHGRTFKRSDLRAHFRSKGWYVEDPSFSESRLSSVEKRNAEYIRNYRG